MLNPKGTSACVKITVSNSLYRLRINSVGMFGVHALTVRPGTVLPDLVVGVGSIDLVVGELDR